MSDLREKIRIEVKRIIDEETESGRFTILSEEHLNVILQIVMTEILEDVDPKNFRANNDITTRKSAELIFVAAPTGAGKDTLVMKIKHDNSGKKYVVLNMDKFRHYYPAFEEYLQDEYPEGLKDRDFALQTNGFSYEIYYTMQRLLLENFPGTNIIITGTIRESDWVEQTFRDFKSNPYTRYTNKLFALAVPKKICAFSAIKRYLLSINKYEPGTARYVSNEYYNDTVENFTDNLGYFERCYNSEQGLIDVMEVYRRSTVQNDYTEDTILYTTDVPGKDKTDTRMAVQKIVNRILSTDAEITSFALLVAKERVKTLKDYLIEQELYEEVGESIESFYEKKINIDSESKREPIPVIKYVKEKYPGSDD